MLSTRVKSLDEYVIWPTFFENVVGSWSYETQKDLNKLLAKRLEDRLWANLDNMEVLTRYVNANKHLVWYIDYSRLKNFLVDSKCSKQQLAYKHILSFELVQKIKKNLYDPKILRKLISENQDLVGLINLVWLKKKLSSFSNPEYASLSQLVSEIEKAPKHDKLGEHKSPSIEILQSKQLLSPRASQIKPLFKAIEEKSLANLKKLQAEHADFQAQDEQTGDTILHHAVEIGVNDDVIDFLINETACDINQRNKNGETPLFKAVKEKNPVLIKKLEKHGAAKNLRYPLSAAQLNGEATLIEFTIAKRFPLEIIDLLMSFYHGYNINSQLPSETVPVLHCAAFHGNIEAMEHIINVKGANIESQFQGLSVLHFAIVGNQDEAVKILIEKKTWLVGSDDYLKNHAVNPQIKNRIRNYLSKRQQEIENETREDHLTLLTKEIATIFERAHPESKEIEQQIRSTLSATQKLPASENAKKLARYIEYFFKKNAFEFNKSRGDNFKKTLKNAIDNFNQPGKTAAFEIISYQIAKDQKTITQEFIKQKLQQDKRLENIPIDEEKLSTFIKEELKFTFNELNKIHKDQAQAILENRISSGINNYLFEANQMDSEEALIHLIAKKLAERLNIFSKIHRKKGMKDKKIGLTVLGIKQVLKSEMIIVLKESNELDNFKNNTNKIEDLINYLFDRLQNNNMNKFSISIPAQQKYFLELKNILKDWLRSVLDKQVLVSKNPSALFIHQKPLEEYKFSANQRLFVDSFCKEFDYFYCHYTALNQGSVRMIQERIDEVESMVSSMRDQKLRLLNSEIPVGEIAYWIARLAVYRRDRQVRNAANRINLLFGCRLPKENTIMIESSAESLAKTYEMQINRLTGICVPRVARYAVHCAIQYITSSDENLTDSQPTNSEFILHHLSNLIFNNKYNPTLIPTLKDPIEAIVAGVTEGRTDDSEVLKPVSTIYGEQWLPEGIFRNVGFIVNENKSHRLFYHPKLVSKEHSLIYGYRHVDSKEIPEIIKAGYIEDNKTDVESVLKRFRP